MGMHNICSKHVHPHKNLVASTRTTAQMQRRVPTLLPMSMMVMLGLACCRASSSQLAKCSNVCGQGPDRGAAGAMLSVQQA